MTQVPDLARLVRETSWIRALAQSLVADTHLAEDLAQDAVAAALSAAHAQRGPVRSWRAYLAASLRRRLFEHRREGAARAQREHRSARPEALPSTLAMVERAGLQRDLVQAVLELEEPCRSAILWRFFEELPPREIARRSRAPVATVNARIQRGLAQLRTRLARAHANQSGERGWVLALLPLLAPPPPLPPLSGSAPLLPTLLMKTSTQLGLLALLLAGGALVLRSGARPGAEAPVQGATDAEPAPLAPLETAAFPEPHTDAPLREAVRPAEPVAGPVAPEPDVAALPRRVAGLALDASGRGLAGAELVARPGGERFRSGAGGRFELELTGAARMLESADPRYATVLAGAAETTAETGALIVLAPRLALAGHVLDESGVGLAGAELALQLPAGFGADFGLALDGALKRAWNAVSAADGAFALADVPWVEGARWSASLGGFEPLTEVLPEVSRADLVLTLRRVRTAEELVRGLVLRADGRAAAGARVAFGLATTVADAHGRFELAARAGERPVCVQALLPGCLPASETRAQHGGTWPAELVLRLGGEPLALAGRVLGPDGAPAARAKVWLAEPTWFGGVEGDVTSVEALVGRDDRRFWAFAECAADGSFELAGLEPRAYRLRAVDPATLLWLESEPIPAGTRDVRLAFPAEAVHERVRGRVLAGDGAGIAGVTVTMQRMALEYAFPDGGTRDEFTVGASTVTDAEGRFEFARVARAEVELFASGDAILFAAAQLTPTTDPGDVRIRAERRVHLQVELAPPHGRADALQVLDESGARLLLRVMRGTTSETNSRARLTDGRSHVLSVSERARWVVLQRGEAEVARLAFRPAPAGVNLVRW